MPDVGLWIYFPLLFLIRSLSILILKNFTHFIFSYLLRCEVLLIAICFWVIVFLEFVSCGAVPQIFGDSCLRCRLPRNNFSRDHGLSGPRGALHLPQPHCKVLLIETMASSLLSSWGMPLPSYERYHSTTIKSEGCGVWQPMFQF